MKGEGARRAGAALGPPALTASARLALEVDELLEQVVRRRDHARVGLEAALRGDHVRELGREVDVRHLDRARGGQAEVAARRADVLGAGRRARVPAVARGALEAALVRE